MLCEATPEVALVFFDTRVQVDFGSGDNGFPEISRSRVLRDLGSKGFYGVMILRAEEKHRSFCCIRGRPRQFETIDTDPR